MSDDFFSAPPVMKKAIKRPAEDPSVARMGEFFSFILKYILFYILFYFIVIIIFFFFFLKTDLETLKSETYLNFRKHLKYAFHDYLDYCMMAVNKSKKPDPFSNDPVREQFEKRGIEGFRMKVRFEHFHKDVVEEMNRFIRNQNRLHAYHLDEPIDEMCIVD